MEIKQVNFAEKNFVKEVTKKTQIVLHHTVSGEGVEGDIAWWNTMSDKVATHYLNENYVRFLWQSKKVYFVSLEI